MRNEKADNNDALPVRHRMARLWPWAFAIALIAIAIPYWFALRSPEVGTFHDDAVYLVTAKALAAGDGYRLLHLPGEPPQTKYPPLFAFLLSLVWTMFPSFPENVTWLKMMPLGFCMLWLLLAYHLLRRLGTSSHVAGGKIAMLAAGGALIKISTLLLSETTFAALATASLLCLERVRAAERINWKVVAVAALLAALATLTRTIGIALPVAAVGWFLSRKQWRHAALFGGIVAVCVAPWIGWVVTHQSSGYYGVENYASWTVFSNGIGENAWEKSGVFLRNTLQIVATPAVYFAALPVLIPFLALATAVVLAVGLFRMRNQNSPTVWFLVVYLTLTACWAWPSFRFVVVVLPIFLWIMLQAVPLAWRQGQGTWLAIGLVLLSIPAVIGNYRSVFEIRADGVLAARPVAGWAQFVKTLGWIRHHTDPETLVIGNLDPLYYLYTDRKALRGYEHDPYAIFYAHHTKQQPPLHLWLRPGQPDATVPFVVFQSPDADTEGLGYWQQTLNEYQHRGLLEVAHQVDGFRVLRPTSRWGGDREP